LKVLTYFDGQLINGGVPIDAVSDRYVDIQKAKTEHRAINEANSLNPYQRQNRTRIIER